MISFQSAVPNVPIPTPPVAGGGGRKIKAVIKKN